MAVVYLTFDDGPVAGTDDVVSVLTKKQVKGTVFLVGGQISSNFARGVLKAAKSSRFVEVANHSTTHADHRYREYYSKPTDVVTGFDAATKTLGITAKPVPARFPGRNTWRVGSLTLTDPTNGKDSAAAADKLAKAGYRIYGWDEEWAMKSGRPVGTAEQVVARIKAKLDAGRTAKKGHVVVLMHDIMFRASKGDRTKLERLVDLLQAAGHSFAFMSAFDGTPGG